MAASSSSSSSRVQQLGSIPTTQEGVKYSPLELDLEAGDRRTQTSLRGKEHPGTWFLLESATLFLTNGGIGTTGNLQQLLIRILITLLLFGPVSASQSLLGKWSGWFPGRDGIIWTTHFSKFWLAHSVVFFSAV
ncbi:hypothetical protein FOZ60_005583 [Perkinsus olseni]|uniref:Uncharacterized protein n=1 Tax=Perkinsus olseni TaxID=32597 RepID=A0A7J6NR08_PEROL|nr:hypothetical protein FOZ60_005583 [Perkinsus olseni]